ATTIRLQMVHGGVTPFKTCGSPLKMAPASLLALLPENVLSVTVSMPRLKMAPPLLPEAPLAMVRFWTVNVMPEFTENTPTVPPPLMVITLPTVNGGVEANGLRAGDGNRCGAAAVEGHGAVETHTAGETG